MDFRKKSGQAGGMLQEYGNKQYIDGGIWHRGAQIMSERWVFQHIGKTVKAGQWMATPLERKVEASFKGIILGLRKTGGNLTVPSS